MPGQRLRDWGGEGDHALRREPLESHVLFEPPSSEQVVVTKQGERCRVPSPPRQGGKPNKGDIILEVDKEKDVTRTGLIDDMTMNRTDEDERVNDMNDANSNSHVLLGHAHLTHLTDPKTLKRKYAHRHDDAEDTISQNTRNDGLNISTITIINQTKHGEKQTITANRENGGLTSFNQVGRPAEKEHHHHQLYDSDRKFQSSSILPDLNRKTLIGSIYESHNLLTASKRPRLARPGSNSALR